MKRKAGKLKQDPQQKLKQFKLDIDNFTRDNKGQLDSGDRRGGGLPTKPPRGPVISRKQRRKEERKLKKTRKVAFLQKKKLPTKESIETAKKAATTADNLRRMEENKKKELKRKKADQKRQEQQRIRNVEREKDIYKEGLLESNKQEDRNIKQLEKQLNLKRRKSKNMPMSFKNDGLDFLLEVVDSQYKSELNEDDEDEEDMPKASWDIEDDDDDDEDQPMSEDDEESDDDNDDVKKSKKTGKSVRFSKDVDGSEDEEDASMDEKDEEFPDDDSLEPGDEDDDDFGQSEDEQNHTKPGADSDEDVADAKPAVVEDIYGRLRDSRGAVVKDTGAYVPPGRRLQMAAAAGDSGKQIQLEKMRKQIKGWLNRLSESNLPSICSDIEALYRSHSRMDVTATLTDLVRSACVSDVIIPERLIMEHVLLVAVLHFNVGSHVGAHMLETMACRFGELLASDNYNSTKEIDNILVVLANLYNFKVTHSVLMYDIIKKLSDRFTESDIPLILLLLKNVGLSLRKDDPAEFKELILLIQDKASKADTSKAVDPSRVRFMLDVLLAVKNNNMRKIPNYDPTHLEQLKKALRAFVQGSSGSDSELRVTLTDLMDADTKGRWWLVGSAWKGHDSENRQTASASTGEDTPSLPSGVSAHILDLARQQRMNTDVRRNIFCVILTSEDFVDAFEKLLHLGLTHKSEREIVHVCVDLCLQEKTYNQFYALLTQKFCEYNRRFLMTLQMNLWDKFRALDELGEVKMSNLASFMTHLLVSKALSMSVLKTVEFGELDKVKVRFLKKLLIGLLLNQPEHIIGEVFSRISDIAKLQLLREGLKLFLRHFILRDKKMLADSDKFNTLKDRVELAEKALVVADSRFLL